MITFPKKRNPFGTFIKLVFLMMALALHPMQSQAQLLLGARGTSMGQAMTALHNDTWNVFANPALLPEDGRSVSFYGIRYFGFAELTDMAIAAHYAHDWGTFGLGVHSYGDDLYRENRFRLAYRRGYEGMYAGVVINYTHFSIENHGSAGALVIDAGIAFNVVENLWFGARATNLTRSSIGQNPQELPRELAIGVAYTMSDRGTLSSDIVKDARFPLSYRGGIEVRVFDQLYARGGVTTEPLTYSAGLGFKQNRWGVNIVAQQHYVMGWNPGFDFNINF